MSSPRKAKTKIGEDKDTTPLVAELKGLTTISVEYIQAATTIIRELYSVARANPLIGITAALFTADFFEKINLMRHSTAQALREAVFQAIGLSFDFSKAEIARAWINDIPVLGFFVPGANIKTETILNTSMTIDAKGGETILREAVEQAGLTSRAREGQGAEEGPRVSTLLKLLEAASVAGAAG